jgi:5-methyltetrahydropteroyltriglutamate--homocysteine methyltransferase
MSRGRPQETLPVTDPPFRAEHIGSLLRPRALKDAHKAALAGEAGEASWRAALEGAIAEAIRMQEAVGLRVITDGEFRRASWFSAFFEALEGFGLAESRFRFRDGEGTLHAFRSCRAEAPIRRSRGITTGEYEFVRARTERQPKVTMPTPSAFHFFCGGGECADPAVYPDLDRFWDDLVAVYRAEIAALDALGAAYVQLDEVPLAMLCDPGVREQVRAEGEDPDALVDLYVQLVNRVLEGRPERMRIAIHLCRGNFRGRWLAAGGYEAVAEKLFNELAVDAFFLEYDTPRAGDFSPLALVPEGKVVVLGLVSTKTPILESVDALRARIDQAARHLPLENLALSPQCGFASVAGGNPLSEDDQRAKLARVVEVADKVWGGS